MRHREFFVDPVVINPIDPCRPMYHVAFTEHGGESSLLHVIEYAAFEELEAENARLILTLKKAYKKHVQDDPRIGWNELGDILMSTLCDSIGDDEFVKFCEQE